MERVHYRRVIPDREAGAKAGRPERRRPAASYEAEPSGFRERLIVQAIISGVLLAAVLALCLFNSRWTGNARAGLEQALDGYTTAEGLADGALALGQTYLPFVFGEKEPAALIITEPPITDAPAAEPTAPAEPAAPIFSEYIDEEVLAELNASKSTAPETSAAPGP